MLTDVLGNINYRFFCTCFNRVITDVSGSIKGDEFLMNDSSSTTTAPPPPPPGCFGPAIARYRPKNQTSATTKASSSGDALLGQPKGTGAASLVYPQNDILCSIFATFSSARPYVCLRAGKEKHAATPGTPTAPSGTAAAAPPNAIPVPKPAVPAANATGAVGRRTLVAAPS